MPAYGNFFLWPVEGVEGDTSLHDEFHTTIIETISAEYRNADWSASRMVIDLSGLLFTSEQRRLLRGFMRVLAGRQGLFLFTRANDDEYQMQRELLGVGDGGTTDFYLRLYDAPQGLPATYAIKYPDHDYPPTGLTANGDYARPTNYIQVTVSGALQTLNVAYVVYRESGLIRFTAGHIPAPGAEVRVSGGFYIPVRFDQDGFPLQPRGGGIYAAKDGTTLIQPKGA